MGSLEKRVIQLTDSLFASVNALLSTELQLHGTSVAGSITNIDLLEFLYAYTYSASVDFSSVYAAFVASSVISTVPTSGTVLQIEDDLSLTYLGQDLDLTTYAAGNFLINGKLYVHDDVRETVVISTAIATIDLSTLSNTTAPLLAAWDAANIESYTQVSHLTFPQWLAFGGDTTYANYEQTITEAVASSISFWKNL